MAHPRQLDPAEILRTALQLLEAGDAQGLSLRAVAAALDVKAPSLYRYFPDKAALESAIAAAGTTLLHQALQKSVSGKRGQDAFRAMAKAYLAFARTRPALYFFLTQSSVVPYASPEGKALWNEILRIAGGVSGHPDDTDGAVALWSFLHGFAALEHSGRFGKSGPRGALERGLAALIEARPPVRR